ncbi:MAG: hypothetical protein JNL98_23980 [Bryobacterales bacterium]|nr:hypothetical protein [Bryobacterales bacterium]
MDLYPCDALFVHRDAEGFPSSLRREEIAAAARGIPTLHVPVVPVRMTEAWLLADEQAIRRAAGNPKGKDPLSLPDVHRLEDVPDPKSLLYGLLRQASGLNRRRLSAQFRPQARVHGIPNYTGDYSRLDALPAFRALQADIRRLAESLLTA